MDYLLRTQETLGHAVLVMQHVALKNPFLETMIMQPSKTAKCWFIFNYPVTPVCLSRTVLCLPCSKRSLLPAEETLLLVQPEIKVQATLIFVLTQFIIEGGWGDS